MFIDYLLDSSIWNAIILFAQTIIMSSFKSFPI